MPRIAYEKKHFGSQTLAVIDQANAILAEYAGRGIAVTLALGLSLAVANAETPEQIQALDREWAQACVQADLAKLAGPD